METRYTICLGDYEAVLPEIAACIGAPYVNGSFSQVEDRFCSDRKEQEEWRLDGTRGYFAITLEKYEGYFFSKFFASHPYFQRGKEILWNAYISQGGNPDAQQRP